MQELVHSLELAAAGITVACTGAMLAIIHVVFSPALDSEVEDDSDQRQQWPSPALKARSMKINNADQVS